MRLRHHAAAGNLLLVEGFETIVGRSVGHPNKNIPLACPPATASALQVRPECQPELRLRIPGDHPPRHVGPRHGGLATAHSEHVRNEPVRQVVVAQNALETSLEAKEASQALEDAAQTCFDAALEAYLDGFGTMTAVILATTQPLQEQAAAPEVHSGALSAAASLAFATGALGGTPVQRRASTGVVGASATFGPAVALAANRNACTSAQDIGPVPPASLDGWTRQALASLIPRAAS